MNIQAIARVLVPNPRLDILLRMAKTLVRDAPPNHDEVVAAALARLEAQIAKVEAALASRIRATSATYLLRELEFDRAVDSLWVLLRLYLESFSQAFSHPGLAHLSLERKQAMHYEELRELADLAADIHARLFAQAGTSFTRTSMVSQVEAMSTLLRVICEDQLDDGIAEVFSDMIVPTLVLCQAQYEALVDDRLRRDSRSSDDFRALRSRLRWLVERYKAALETNLYDEDAPETEALVEAALRPLLMVSAQMVRGSVTVANTELDVELVANEFELDASVFGDEGADGSSASDAAQ